jgi:hypothetical protein
MAYKELISEYYKTSGAMAKVYKMMQENDTYYSIAFFDKHKVKIATEDFRGKALCYVEDAAENFALGIKHVSPELV